MSEGRLALLLDTARATKEGPAGLAARQRSRFSALVDWARSRSPYLRRLYQTLPPRVDDATVLPVTSKKQLMAHFDEWVTDPDVTLEKARAFVDDPGRMGEHFLGRYTALLTSGTTGAPGIFLLDDRSMAVTMAMMARMVRRWLGARDVAHILARGWRLANVVATGGHFAGVIAAAQRPRVVRAFAVQTPLRELVDQLNRFDPVILGGYASTIVLLAGERAAGRLRIAPIMVLPIAEGLAPEQYDRIGEVFGARVRTSYAATEVPFLSYGCGYRWLHVNSDWVVLEPVDAEYRPTPPGQESHTVLVSNLANRVQPILRYDLGDSILARPDRCPCGDPLPAVRVVGRAADTLTFSLPDGGQVSIPPLALELERLAGIELFQIVQPTPASIRLRLHVSPGADAKAVWRAALSELTRSLATHGLGHVTIGRAQEPPEPSAAGKYRAIIPYEST